MGTSKLNKAINILITLIILLGVMMLLSLEKSMLLKKYTDATMIHIPFFSNLIVIGCTVLIVLLLVIFICFKNDFKENRGTRVIYNLNYMEERNKYLKKPVVILMALIVLNIAGIFYFVNRYNVVYEDKIVAVNLLRFNEKSYGYEDIKEVNVGASRRKSGADFYYKIYFKDGRSMDLSGSTASKNSFLSELKNINDKIKKLNIKRNVDSKYLGRMVEDLNSELRKQYEGIFRN
jgi:hypothetical protein